MEKNWLLVTYFFFKQSLCLFLLAMAKPDTWAWITNIYRTIYTFMREFDFRPNILFTIATNYQQLICNILCLRLNASNCVKHHIIHIYICTHVLQLCVIHWTAHNWPITKVTMVKCIFGTFCRRRRPTHVKCTKFYWNWNMSTFWKALPHSLTILILCSSIDLKLPFFAVIKAKASTTMCSIVSHSIALYFTKLVDCFSFLLMLL